MAVVSGTVLCGTGATKLCTMGESGALVYADAIGVFLGGPNVVTGTAANGGVPLPATTYVQVPGARVRSSVQVPSGADDTADLYVISVAGTQHVSFLTPQGG